jgi:large subunit ribosomal protein L23
MINRIISLKPNITEKAFTLAAEGKYTFIVNEKADKETIKNDISRIFKVTVEKVNIIRIPGKIKRTRKGIGKRKNILKAIVSLKKGEKIDIFESEKEKEPEKKVAKKDK